MNFTSEPRRWIGEKSGHRRLFLFPMWPHWLHLHSMLSTFIVFWTRLLKGVLLGLPRSTASFIPWVPRPNNIQFFLSIHFLIVFKISQMWKAAIPKGQSLNALLFMILVESYLEHNLSFDPGSNEWDLGRSTPPSLMVYLESTDI